MVSMVSFPLSVRLVWGPRAAGNDSGGDDVEDSFSVLESAEASQPSGATTLFSKAVPAARFRLLASPPTDAHGLSYPPRGV